MYALPESRFAARPWIRLCTHIGVSSKLQVCGGAGMQQGAGLIAAAAQNAVHLTFERCLALTLLQLLLRL